MYDNIIYDFKLCVHLKKLAILRFILTFPRCGCLQTQINSQEMLTIRHEFKYRFYSIPLSLSLN